MFRVFHFNFILSVIIILFSCGESPRELRIDAGEYEMEGRFFKDSTPDGIITFYKKGSKQIAGAKTFSKGILEGQSWNFNNGKLIQVAYYKHGLEHGYATTYDSINEAKRQEIYYHWGNRIGPSYEYNSEGKVSAYEFVNFEGNVLFSSQLDSNGKYQHDNLARLATMNFNYEVINNAKRIRLFTYLIHPPGLEVEYKLHFYNAKESKPDSLTLEKSNIFYWEQHMDIDSMMAYPVIIVSVNDSTLRKMERIYSRWSLNRM